MAWAVTDDPEEKPKRPIDEPDYYDENDVDPESPKEYRFPPQPPRQGTPLQPMFAFPPRPPAVAMPQAQADLPPHLTPLPPPQAPQAPHMRPVPLGQSQGALDSTLGNILPGLMQDISQQPQEAETAPRARFEE